MIVALEAGRSQGPSTSRWLRSRPPAAQELSIAVANNLGPDGDVGSNASTAILAELARQLAPESPLPARMG